jgi:hypothetical protein
MNLEFTLGDLPLEKNEVSALFSVSEKNPTISVDITKHFDHKLFDAKKLFNLSVEQRNPQLATLAAKLAIYKPAKPRRAYTKTGRSTIGEQPVKQLTVDETFNTLLTNQSLKTAGAAALLFMCATGDKVTLKETAVAVVNMLDDARLDNKYDCFRGFRRKIDGSMETCSAAPGVARSDCYHASPMYTSLRDGLSFLVRSGLAVMEEQVAFGPQDKERIPHSQFLRRKVYHVTLTETGMHVCRMWDDMEDYIIGYWSKRGA